MNISILLPSRGRPDSAKSAINKLFALAAQPEQVEVIIRTDNDDPKVARYQALTSDNIKVIVGESHGYVGIWRYFEECYNVSRGQVVVDYIDDAEMETPGWDSLYLSAAKSNPLAAISSHISSPSEGRDRHYRWALPACSRTLYEHSLMKQLPDPGLALITSRDRVWDAYAEASGQEIQADVWITHYYTESTPGNPRGDYYAHVRAHWSEFIPRWRQAGEGIMKNAGISPCKISWLRMKRRLRKLFSPT